jgi:uncharacterized protein
LNSSWNVKSSRTSDRMPFVYRNLMLSPEDGEELLLSRLASRLALTAGLLSSFQIIRKGVDARKKGQIKLVYTVSFSLTDEAQLIRRIDQLPDLEWKPATEQVKFAEVQTCEKIVIAGTGPAGLFAALRLAEYGLTATVIERGQPVEQRARDVSRFWREGLLDPESNVQFGEGGAGTFSDGKLTSRSKDPLVPWVLERLTDFGAQQEIRYLAKPHIGTDRLRHVVSSIRSFLLERGFEIRFGCRLSGITVRNGAVAAVAINNAEELVCDRLILATGHSARDTYEMLEEHQVAMERKPFAIGLRVEHPQGLIDCIQYGGPRHKNLPTADYALAWNNNSTGRSAYSFCMCPGGIVIAGASEAGGVVTNGMSGQMRNSPFANSALVVNVRPDDFGGDGPLAGVHFQRYWEQRAFLAGSGGFRAPAQNLMDFMRLPGKGGVSSSYRPTVVEADLSQVLPDYVVTTLKEGLNDFGRRLRGFVTAEACLIGIESRTSAPVRVVRNEQMESVSVSRLYPTGEGAGYAGGIMSSAVDGVKVADLIAGSLSKKGV